VFVLLDTYYHVHINIGAMTTIIADKPSMVREDPGEAIVYDQRGQLWFQEAVFYEVYVRAFCDSNGDGRGDLQVRKISNGFIEIAII
jgi:hypothetical protein